ncbi:MAG TPA: DNA polymerase IV [Pirellulales bacterium]|nr:DNA polymerase IV [Pirellulales bacterium]
MGDARLSLVSERLTSLAAAPANAVRPSTAVRPARTDRHEPHVHSTAASPTATLPVSTRKGPFPRVHSCRCPRAIVASHGGVARMILHVDMDAFYASVEEREQPELVGKPLIVGGTPEGRGVVAAANYEVRKYGVHSAMPTATALRLCPHAIVVRPRMAFYTAISEQIREIFDQYTPLVEPLSLDEAFLDATGSEQLFGSSVDIGREIKRTIRQRLRLTASVGVAPNKFLAKIASDLKKPDGLVMVDGERVHEFLDPLPVGRLWGVGRVTGQVFDELGIKTIGEVRRTPRELLRKHFGQTGDHLWQLAHGIDERRVVPDRDAKSISHETTFASDVDDMETLRAWAAELTEQVGWRLRRHRLRGRTVQIKVRYADFHTITRAETLAAPTDVTEVIWQTAARLLVDRLPTRRLLIRLLGIGVSHFENPEQTQRSLFEDPVDERQSRLDKTADTLKERFGADALKRGSILLHGVKHEAAPRPRKPDERTPGTQ